MFDKEGAMPSERGEKKNRNVYIFVTENDIM